MEVPWRLAHLGQIEGDHVSDGVPVHVVPGRAHQRAQRAHHQEGHVQDLLHRGFRRLLAACSKEGTGSVLRARALLSEALAEPDSTL